MSFIKKYSVAENNHRTNIKKPFYKRKGWKVFFILFGAFLISLISFVAYIYSNGSKIFENSTGSSLVQAIMGGQKLNGEADGRVNILVMGRGGDNHPGGLLTDSMMVISIGVKEKKMAIVSVPRDLLVPIKNHNQDKLNSAFASGYNDYLDKSCKKKKQSDCYNDALAAGSGLAKDTVANVLGVPIQYYVMMDFVGFKQLVDKLGGLDIMVDKAIYDPMYPDKNMKGYETFSIKAGQQHMNGEIALKYSRSRETTSDFDRSRRQQQVIFAIKDKVLQADVLTNPKKILDIVTIMGNHLRTNFQTADLKELADLIKSTGQNEVIEKVISSASDSYLVSDSSSGTFYLRPKGGNFNEIQKMMKNIFLENNQDKTALRVEILNASKTAGLGTKAAALLKDNQFEVVAIKNTSEKSKYTLIYDYTKGANQTAVDFLKSKYKAEVVQKTRNANDVDITIIIGDDFNTSASGSSGISKR